MKRTHWYKDAVVYQIYPRSFCDSNGDGIGDIPGIISKLDHLKELGVNCVWLSPIYKSPQHDNGYDISDYYDIYPPFGTMDDFKEMLKQMHDRGIRLIMDLVVNHTSNEHMWFKEAIKDKSSPYRDYYFFRKGKKKKLPNNWGSFFMEKAWEKEPNGEEYYLHLFAKEQPDLNWENKKVREEVKKLLTFWLDLGVDGFRCDVITAISKTPGLPNGKYKPVLSGLEHFVNGPKLHDYLQELNRDVFSKYDCATVGETILSSIDDAKLLVGPDRNELDMIFNFDHTDTDNYFGYKYLVKKFSLRKLKKVYSNWQHALYNNGWNSLFIENHDQRRSVGRFNTSDTTYRIQSAKMLLCSYFFLQGTPFIYQGQEIGMTNCDFKKESDFVDVEAINTFKLCRKNKLFSLFLKKNIKNVSRDNSRTPVQWDDSIYAGFSTVKPWIKVNDNHTWLNVENDKKDPNGVLAFFKEAIKYRKGNEIIKNGTFKDLLPKHKKLFIYEREFENKKVIVCCNFTNKIVKHKLLSNLTSNKIVLSNYNKHLNDCLKPYEVIVYEK